MASEIVVPKEPMNPATGLMSIIEGLAANPQVDIDKLHQLLQMQERWEVNNDKKKFREAMAAFKLNPPEIVKNKHVSFKTDKGQTDYDHATLDAVCDAIVKRLAESGITHRWVPTQPTTGGITITCVLSLGMFSEDTPLSASPDQSGGKNPVQAIASTVSYLERYTLLAATGCATGMPDDDGIGSVTSEDKEVVKTIATAKSMEELKSMYEAALKQATEAKNQTLVGLLVKAKKDRKAELSNAKAS